MKDKTTFIPQHSLNTAVLFLIFNRLDTTKQVFEAIREAKPPRLYIAADGARIQNEGEAEKIKVVREYVMSHIDWQCDVKTLFREQNLGCKCAVSGAITWFFENEEMGIILEDDCLPNQSFFWFCEELLDKYKNTCHIRHISGFNPLGKYKCHDEDYVFSRYGIIWGWATWRRAWENYDYSMKTWEDFDKRNCLADLTDYKSEYYLRHAIYSAVYEGKIDTWDYQWSYAKLVSDSLSIIPKVNLVKNIGFGEDSTHTKGKLDKKHEKVYPLSICSHPKFPVRNKSYDAQYVKSHLFNPKLFLLREIFAIIKYYIFNQY